MTLRYNVYQIQSSQYYAVMISTTDTQFLMPAVSFTSYILLSHLVSWNFSFLMCKMGLIIPFTSVK